jgi:hypothetical protein
MRAATLVLLAAVLVLALPVRAHEGHSALPEGFRAEVVTITTADGEPATLPGVAFAVDDDGMGLTVENSTPTVLEVMGERAGEPLVRVTARAASVNETSPQAADVTGARVDPDAVAPLVDLAWGRVEPVWVALPAGGTVSFVDHRAAPGHPPDRAEHRAGDVAGEWRVAFSYDGEPYQANGRIVAVGDDAGGGGLLLWVGVGLAILAVGGGALKLLR